MSRPAAWPRPEPRANPIGARARLNIVGPDAVPGRIGTIDTFSCEHPTHLVGAGGIIVECAGNCRRPI